MDQNDEDKLGKLKVDPKAKLEEELAKAIKLIQKVRGDF